MKIRPYVSFPYQIFLLIYFYKKNIKVNISILHRQIYLTVNKNENKI